MSQKCIKEILKDIKTLESRKCLLLSEERNNSVVTYSNAADKIETGYNFMESRKQLDNIDFEIRKLKHLVNVVNTTTVIPEYNLTIDECIIFLAQLNNELRILDSMRQKKSVVRKSCMGSNIIEFTETCYNVEECKDLFDKVNAEIQKLQMCIDRINLTEMIEVQ